MSDQNDGKTCITQGPFEVCAGTDEATQNDNLVATASVLLTANAAAGDMSATASQQVSATASANVGEDSKNSPRRANFAAPESGDGRKRSTGGIDSLGGGRLP